MSNLLLITDVARLRKIFGRLTEDKNIRLRVVNNLEKGGEEIALEKPDMVFVQTHLSGLSADILLMHLKKQLGRKRSRFVLLAAPGQTSAAILKPYHGWLDTSAEDSPLLTALQQLIVELLSKPKKTGEASSQPGQIAAAGLAPQSQSVVESPALSGTFPLATASVEPSLEEQGITYAPRQRLNVYSEFNNSFDSAVSSAPEAETLDQAAPLLTHDWRAENVDTAESKPIRTKRGTFLLWLVPVIIVVVAITYLQQQKPAVKPEAVADKTVVPAAAVKPAVQTPSIPTPAAPAVPVSAPAKALGAAPAAPQTQDRTSDKAVMTALSENRSAKIPPPAVPAGTRPTSLPDFIPRYGFDKQYGAANPGWERYKGLVTEFKVLREAQKIKAIQIVDRGGNGIPESFMKAVVRQTAKNPAVRIESSEKKDGYEVQRGRLADNISVVYYRDEAGGKLRAFVLTWH